MFMTLSILMLLLQFTTPSFQKENLTKTLGAEVTSARIKSGKEEEQKVRAVIDSLFIGMKTGDSALVRRCFHSAASLHTSSIRQSAPVFRVESVEEFVRSVGAPKATGVVYDERLLSYEIRIDDAMATAWTPYKFYVGDKFSHCGVNAFHLTRTLEGWKITHVSDTRRKEPCP